MKERQSGQESCQNVISVEKLAQRLLRRKSSRPAFKFPLTSEQGYRLMLSAYVAEVRYRRREYRENAATLEYIRRLTDNFTEPAGKFGVMLSGNPGNGKTTLLYALQNAIGYMNDAGVFPQKTLLCVVQALEVNAAAKRGHDTFREVCSLPLLGIEELGREPVEIMDYGNVLSPIVDLICYRYDRQLPTVITTNLTPAAIRERYGDRIADRFNEMLNVIVFENPSFRD